MQFSSEREKQVFQIAGLALAAVVGAVAAFYLLPALWHFMIDVLLMDVGRVIEAALIVFAGIVFSVVMTAASVWAFGQRELQVQMISLIFLGCITSFAVVVTFFR